MNLVLFDNALEHLTRIHRSATHAVNLIHHHRIHAVSQAYMYSFLRLYIHVHVVVDSCKPDTIGTALSVLNSEVSSFQGLLSAHIRHLGLSCLWRCPHFRGPV